MLSMSAFEVGDLVWAKMRGFSPWPSMISKPDAKVKQPKVKEPLYYVFFFGTNNYSWIAESNIFSYEEGEKKLFGDKNVHGMKKAVEDMKAYAVAHPPKRKIIPTPKANGISSLKPQAKRQFQHPASTSKVRIQKTPGMKRESKSLPKSMTKKRRMSDDFYTSSFSTSSSKIDKYALLRTSPVHSSTKTSSSSFISSRIFPEKSESTHVDSSEENEKVKKKNIIPTNLKIGFLSHNVIGSIMIRNLLQTGHKVTIWGSSNRGLQFSSPDLTIAHSIADVVKASDVICSYLNDSLEAKEVFYSSKGIMQSLSEEKGFIQMTPIDPSLSHSFDEAIKLKKGRYLELQLLGTRQQAEDGLLTLLAAGDEKLCQECKSCFQTIGESICYLGESVGKAVKMNVLVSMITGSCYSAVAEAMALAERCGISLRDVVDIFGCGDLKCPVITDGGNSIANNMHGSGNLPLQQIQKILHLALDVGEQCQLPLPTTAASHEAFKRAEQLGYKNHDASAVYMSARF